VALAMTTLTLIAPVAAPQAEAAGDTPIIYTFKLPRVGDIFGVASGATISLSVSYSGSNPVAIWKPDSNQTSTISGSITTYTPSLSSTLNTGPFALSRSLQISTVVITKTTNEDQFVTVEISGGITDLGWGLEELSDGTYSQLLYSAPENFSDYFIQRG
jgi:hypothetical protein